MGDYMDKTYSLLGGVTSKLESYPNDKFIVFVHSKSIGKRLLGLLNDMGMSANFHNAELSTEQRRNITEMFKSKKGCRVLIATSTLAYGLNLPARRVIIAGVQRGIEDIPVMDLIQEAGRAGRVGLDPKGDAYILYPESKEQVYVGMLQDPSRLIIESQLSDKYELAFHIISEINDNSNTFDSLYKWYERSFAVKRGSGAANLRDVIEDLCKLGVIKEQEGKYLLSATGKIAAWLYYSPYMVASLQRNFQELPPDASSLSVAWAVGTAMPEYPVSSDLRDEIKGLFGDKKIPRNQEAYCYAAYLLLKGTPDGQPELISLVRTLQGDSERLGTALKTLKGFYKMKYDTEVVGYQLKYGILTALVPLVKLKGIGPARAQKLYDAGLKSVEDIKRSREIASKIIGNRQIMEEILNNAA